MAYMKMIVVSALLFVSSCYRVSEASEDEETEDSNLSETTEQEKMEEGIRDIVQRFCLYLEKCRPEHFIKTYSNYEYCISHPDDRFLEAVGGYKYDITVCSNYHYLFIKCDFEHKSQTCGSDVSAGNTEYPCLTEITAAANCVKQVELSQE